MAKFSLGSTGKLGLGVAIGLAIGAAGGAGAVSLTRPGVEMAPTVATPVARLANSSGVVTVKGRVAEVYGDRFVVQDGSGKAMVDGGRDANVTKGAPIQVQGRYDDGQLRASYVVDAAGKVTPVGPPPPRLRPPLLSRPSAGGSPRRRPPRRNQDRPTQCATAAKSGSTAVAPCSLKMRRSWRASKRLSRRLSPWTSTSPSTKAR